MRFWFSISDFLTVGELCWKVYKKCKDSPGNYAELSREVGSLHNVLKETEEVLLQQDLTQIQKQRLAACVEGCESVLNDLDALLQKYERLGTKSQRTFDRMGFGTHDMDAIRLRLISNVSLLDAFNNVSSHARLEHRLNLLITEVRSGRREGSIVSIASNDTVARNDRETWDALRKELEDIGISPSVVSEKREFIISWFQEAVAAGKLQEAVPYDDYIDEGTTCSSDPGRHSHQAERDCGSDHAVVGWKTNSTEIKVDSHTKPMAGNSAAVAKLSSPSEAPNRSTSEALPKDKRSRKWSLLSILPASTRNEGFIRATDVGDLASASKYLNSGVDINMVVDGWTALHRAADRIDERTAQYLLEKGAKVSLKASRRTSESVEIKDMTPLHYAIYRGSSRMARLLLNYNADISLKSGEYHALSFGVITNKIDHGIMKLLLENGADIESRTKDGETPLHLATFYGKIEMIRVLLEHGANIESKCHNGMTPLMVAARYGDKEAVSSLLAKGADFYVKGGNGMTAMQLAKIPGYTAVYRLLCEASHQSD